MDNNLPIAPEAIGNYVTYKKIGTYVYTSGHVPITEQKKYIGKVLKNDLKISYFGVVFYFFKEGGAVQYDFFF